MQTKELSFKASKEDFILISQITKRAVSELGVGSLDTMMDITACHVNGNPLRLQDLLESDSFNLAHDIFGIARHLDRETGELTGFFSPRFSK